MQFARTQPRLTAALQKAAVSFLGTTVEKNGLFIWITVKDKDDEKLNFIRSLLDSIADFFKKIIDFFKGLLNK